MTLNETIEAVRKQFRTDLDSFPDQPADIETLRTKYFGRKGQLAGLFSRLRDVPPEEKPRFGRELNTLRKEFSDRFDDLIKSRGLVSDAPPAPAIDYSLPGLGFPSGSIHPLQQILDRINTIFKTVGFSIGYGPEIDDDYHNFQALNFPRHHPARDMQDTFFIDEDTVLRTHTSNVQVHLMEKLDPPLRYIVPGRVYRNEAISYKSYCLFHQVEGLYVGRKVSFADLRGTIEYFIQHMFGSNVKTRFRPSFFPFTEPSAEVDIWNPIRRQWLEIMGCGMVDPAVFESVGYDPAVWHGYAFGMGVERIAMLKYGISDIRHFYQNDVRFLEQF